MANRHIVTALYMFTFTISIHNRVM